MIAADGVTVMFGDRRVLADVSLTVAAGTVTAIVGPNGAGKSTLIKALAGLIKPSAGRVLFDDKALEAIALGERARAIAYLPQEREVHWPLIAREIVALGRIPFSVPGAPLSPRDRAAIAAAITAMDADHLADRPILELSGGERARILMARALAQTPRVLIADEPTAGLDPAHQLQLFRHVRAIADAGIAVVVALHDLSLAARFADQVALMAAGHIVTQGRPAEVLTPAHLGPVYGVRMTNAVVEGIAVVLPVELLP